MADVVTTLHPEGAPEDNLYPNVKRENLPADVLFSKIASVQIVDVTVPAPTTFGAVPGTTFTVDTPTLVQAFQSYSNATPLKIAIKDVAMGYLNVTQTMGDYTSDGLYTPFVLCVPGKTYEIHAQGSQAGVNAFRVFKLDFYN